MSKRMVLVVVTALAGCSFSSKINGAGFGGSQSGPTSGGATATPSANGTLVVPDLTGKTAAEAEAALRAAGFTFQRLELDDHQCSVADDTKMVPKDTVCAQRPAAGAETGPRLSSPTVTIERDSYDHGGVGGSNEWRRMPDLVGKPIDVARTILARASLPVADQFEIAEDSSDACQPDQVCSTEPAANARKVLARKGRLYVGKARAAAP